VKLNTKAIVLMSIGDWVLISMATIAVIPIVVIAIESMAALAPRRPRSANNLQLRPRCTVLIPAHDEEGGIVRTVNALRPELADGDRIVVIADNCTDSTAQAARLAGIAVVERQDLDRQGKGYALAFGLDLLATDPPDVVVSIDADTRVKEGSLAPLVHKAFETQCPVQGVFTDVSNQLGPRAQWSAFALTFKNLVRPLGLNRLGLPCLLTGSGMAFPWPVIRRVRIGSPNIVEDMQLGIDLALMGHAPRFCPEAYFESDDAPSIKAASARRTRWEHGHMATLISQFPRLIVRGILQLRPRLIALALELSVPPLSFLFLVLVLLFAICLASWQFGGSAVPAMILGVGGIIGIATIFTVWLTFGRKLISPKNLCLLPFYVLWKVPIYLKLMVAPQQQWVRTERNPMG
jgi:cellulose synthase/poly-beta-1,6-N-acetylglucosamine synthase-like glycosyltransferase